jgi:hypothetical protein
MWHSKSLKSDLWPISARAGRNPSARNDLAMAVFSASTIAPFCFIAIWLNQEKPS